jgi:hypothetical protein
MSDETSQEPVPELPLAEHFRKNRAQEAENIRQEYVKRTGRLPLPRPNKSSDNMESHPLKE